METAKDIAEVFEALGLEPLHKYYEAHHVDERVSIADYKPLLRSFGFKVVAQTDENDYQGSSLVLYRARDGHYGVLSFGWGSCSGCDALQACNSWREAEELRRTLMNSILWFDDEASMSAWLHDDSIQQLKHYAHDGRLLDRFRTEVSHALRRASDA